MKLHTKIKLYLIKRLAKELNPYLQNRVEITHKTEVRYKDKYVPEKFPRMYSFGRYRIYIAKFLNRKYKYPLSIKTFHNYYSKQGMLNINEKGIVIRIRKTTIELFRMR